MFLTVSKKQLEKILFYRYLNLVQITNFEKNNGENNIKIMVKGFDGVISNIENCNLFESKEIMVEQIL